MLKQGKTYTLQREKALADGLRDVAAELRLIDATDLIAFLRTEQFANIANLVNSSSELYFKPDTLSFGQSGDINLKWGEAPAIALDMEFHHMRVASISGCCCRRCRPASRSTTSPSAESSADPDENTQRRLVEAIADARADGQFRARSAASAACAMSVSPRRPTHAAPPV